MKEETVIALVIGGIALMGLLLWYSSSQAALNAQNNTTAQKIAAANLAAQQQLQLQQATIAGQQTNAGVVNNLANSGTLSSVADALGDIFG